MFDIVVFLLFKFNLWVLFVLTYVNAKIYLQ